MAEKLVWTEGFINQQYIPDFGYSTPIRTKEACSLPAFDDINVHRVGIFAKSYHNDGQEGYICEYRCVNCGRVSHDNKALSLFLLQVKR